MPIRDKWASVVTACVVSVVIATAFSAAAADPPTCKGELPNTKAYGGIVNVTAKKSWQPRGGEFAFDIETPTSIPSDTLITVCFGWKEEGKSTDTKGFTESRPTGIVKLEPDKKIITIAATVPNLPPALRFSAAMLRQRSVSTKASRPSLSRMCASSSTGLAARSW